MPSLRRALLHFRMSAMRRAEEPDENPSEPVEDTHLRLLRLLDGQPNLSQRALASELGISLGKTNYCLRALVDKGWIKIRNFRNSDNKRGYMYLLTPRGIERKASITVRFLREKRAEYEALKREIELLKREVDAGAPGAAGAAHENGQYPR